MILLSVTFKFSLARLGKTVGFFWVQDRPSLIEPVDEGAVLAVGPTFLGAAAHTKISVAEPQHGLYLSQQLRVKPFLDDVPLIGWVIVGWRPEAFMMDHRAVPRE
jgi:hypothetical protein